ncbi:prolipoprotein diacylglyceryl transferase [Carnobacterium sp. AT7]|uniref:heavy-metal-associated domain-containing protein n=1 Tax=Carnobacterium sp. AT7 TaxID=333990 RepID=UPI00015F1495|nr:heavy-metal-associated domain-containing protein [Carnobacterium sp. AT7]EDP68740.1 prolipoprotein diacylglyceryl transferase [Carnobacterium sp. AT7]
MAKALFKIEPLDCVGCAKKIENQVKELDGIESVRVFPQLGKIRTTFDNQKVTIHQIEKAILLTGHSIHSKVSK